MLRKKLTEENQWWQGFEGWYVCNVKMLTINNNTPDLFAFLCGGCKHLRRGAFSGVYSKNTLTL